MTEKIQIRDYKAEDLNACVELMRLNIPTYFSTEEEPGFAAYLLKEREEYFVAEAEGKIVGCAGINSEGSTGIISWDIIHPDFQGKGIGSALLLFRLNIIKKKYSDARVRTAQNTFEFYGKYGFKLNKIVKDFWADGYDLYQMELKWESES
jgi:[ribosomal protein S18]-alanine N-acetyltransferase